MDALLEQACARVRLDKARPEQRERFDRLAARFAAVPPTGASDLERRFVTPFWRRRFAVLARDLSRRPRYDFLQTQVIRELMTAELSVRETDDALARLAARVPRRRLKRLLLDDPVGTPANILPESLCSANHLHHLSDFRRYLEATDCRLSELGAVLEWGGGFGGMAKVVRRHLPRATYVIVDVELMCRVQRLYLASVFGQRAVRLLARPGERPRAGAINLLPVGLVERARDLRPDLFISTFALNESALSAQRFVAGTDFFGARRLLVAYRERSLKPVIRHALARRGARVERTSRADASYYARL